jgi:molybdopterin adenylyltransferase
MSNSIEIVSVNISTEKGTIKRPVDEVIVGDTGIADDAHAGPWHRQVSMLAQESIERFGAQADRSFAPGDFAENLTTRGLDLSQVAILDRFQIGDVALEITQIGKECHGDGCAIFREVGRCVMPKEGIFCRVLHGGTIRPGDALHHIPRPLKIRVITMSDRAAKGEYQDKSGPRIKELLDEFFAGKRWHVEIESTILPDDADKLRAELTAARDGGADVAITTGGTGAGPRDVTPETASAVCDKIIPGIMENIRIKYGSQKPNALLSRGIAGIARQTQIYTLPGSSRAVAEYMTEILKTLEHIIFMIHGVDVH